MIAVILITAILATIIGANLFIAGFEEEKIARMSTDEKQKYLDEKQNRSAMINQKNILIQHGAVNAVMICPHCQTKGKIRIKPITQKMGVSGGKVVAAILTGGLSLLVIGLSREEGSTQACCGHCNITWRV